MPGPGEIMGRWVAIQLRDYISNWREKRKNTKKLSPEAKFYSNVSDKPYFPGKGQR